MVKIQMINFLMILSSFNISYVKSLGPFKQELKKKKN